MARYINEDEFVAWVKEHWCADCQNDNGLRCRACWIDDAIDIVEEAPTADVAPKSEVAREIFEEIEKAIADLEYRANTPRKTVKVEELKDQVNWVLHEVVPKTIAELKKKYTEDKR